MMRSRSRLFLACWLLTSCSERPTAPPVEAPPDAANAIDAPTDGRDGFIFVNADAGNDATIHVDRCVADVYEEKPLPVDLYVVADGSEAADCPPGERCSSDAGLPGETRWVTVASAIERFAEAPGGARVALGLFPRFADGGNAVSCAGDDYAAPDLPFGASADDVAGLLRARTPRGDWLLRAPLEGALQYARMHAEANPDRQTVVAIMTHGAEASACGNDESSSAIPIAAGALAATPPVKTTTISLLPALAALRRVSEAGGTWPNDINSGSADARGETLAALRAAAASCDYPFPETPTPVRTRDALVLQVRLGPNGGFLEIFRIIDGEHCPAEGGWFFNNNLTPSRVSLCPTTCRSVTTTPGSAVRLVVGCWT